MSPNPLLIKEKRRDDAVVKGLKNLYNIPVKHYYDHTKLAFKDHGKLWQRGWPLGYDLLNPFVNEFIKKKPAVIKGEKLTEVKARNISVPVNTVSKRSGVKRKLNEKTIKTQDVKLDGSGEMSKRVKKNIGTLVKAGVDIPKHQRDAKNL